MSDKIMVAEVKLSFQRKGNDGYDTVTVTFTPDTTEAERAHMRDLAFKEMEEIASRYYGLNDAPTLSFDTTTSGKASYEAPAQAPQRPAPARPAQAPQATPRPSTGNVARIPWDHEGKFGKASYAKGTPITEIGLDYLEWFVSYTKKKEGFWYDACAAELSARQGSTAGAEDGEELYDYE